MIRAKFIDNVINEITEGKALPTSPSLNRIGSIIEEALNYFRQNDDYASEMQYIVISNRVFNTELFKQKHKIQLPDCVYAVTDVRKFGGKYLFMYQPDYVSPLYQNRFGFASNSIDNSLYFITMEYYQDFLSRFNYNAMSYDYSEYTHSLILSGGITEDFYIQAYVYIPEEAMFEMNRFFKYVCGRARVSFANIFSFVEQNAIGGNKINLRDIKEQGQGEIKEVKEEIAAQRDEADCFSEF